MDVLEQTLRQSIETGEVVSVRYMGGSQPGSIRQISPISISGDDARARCLATNRVKGFKLSKMELPIQHKTSNYVAGKVKHAVASLTDGIENYRQQLEAAGWVIQLEKNEAGVYRTFKNGKLRKTPDVYIQYHEQTYDYTDFDDDGNEIEIMKPSTRPWYVRSNPEDRTSTFKTVGSAVEKFIEFTRVAEQRLGL